MRLAKPRITSIHVKNWHLHAHKKLLEDVSFKKAMNQLETDMKNLNSGDEHEIFGNENHSKKSKMYMVYSTMEEIYERMRKKWPISCVETKVKSIMIVMENNIKRELKDIKVKFDYVIEQDYVGIPHYGIGIDNMRSENNMKQIEESYVEKYLLC